MMMHSGHINLSLKRFLNIREKHKRKQPEIITNRIQNATTTIITGPKLKHGNTTVLNAVMGIIIAAIII